MPDTQDTTFHGSGNSYPTKDGGHYSETSTYDANTGDYNSHAEHKLPNGNVVTTDITFKNHEGKVTEVLNSPDGKELGRNERFPDLTEKPSGDTSEFGKELPERGTPESAPPKENDDDKPTDKDPEAEGKCTDCDKVEPSIWSDLGTVAWGMAKGALGAAVIIGIGAVAAGTGPVAVVAVAVGVGIAVVGSFLLGYQIGRGLQGELSREEVLDGVGGLLGGLIVGGIVGAIRKPKFPTEVPEPVPHDIRPTEPVLPKPVEPRPKWPVNEEPLPPAPKKDPPSFVTPGSFSAEESAAIDLTLQRIATGNKPTGILGKKWGTPFKNKLNDLPGGQYENSPFLEYRVPPAPGFPAPGVRRIVINNETGEVFYTWTHYGTAGNPPFVRIR